MLRAACLRGPVEMMTGCVVVLLWLLVKGCGTIRITALQDILMCTQFERSNTTTSFHRTKPGTKEEITDLGFRGGWR